MEEFVQEFRRVARGSVCEGKPLVKQWYNKTIALNRN